MKLIKKSFLSMLIVSLIMFTACEKEKTEVTGVLLNKSTLTLVVDSTEQLIATIEPANAEETGLFWITGDATIASVVDGEVTGVSPGETTITVSTVDGDFTAVCSVIVTANIVNVTGITLDKTTASIIVAGNVQLNENVLPTDATNKTVTWQSSSDGIATVNTSGLVTGVSSGVVTITATTIDGNKTATCEVSVTAVGTITEIMTKGFLKTPAIGGSVNGVGVDIICNNSGIPYFALNVYDASLDSKASTEVWSYSGTGTSWNQLGSRVGICDDEALAPSIVIKDDGTVYVAFNYYENETDNRYDTRIVAEYSGTTWTTLGGNGASNNNCFIMNGSAKLKGASEFAIKEDGTLMIILESSGDGYVNYFTDTKWESYNGYKTDSESFWNGGIDIATVGNKPYVSIRTGSGDGKIGILEGSEINGQNGQWEWLASYASGSHNAKFQADEISESPLTISSTGDIYTCYRYYGTSDEMIAVKKFNETNTSWTSIYNNNSNSNEVGIIVSNDILYLVIANYDGGIDIHKYNSETNTWNLEGTTPQIDTYYNIELTAGINGEFFIAYECTYSDAGKVGIYKYTPVE